MTSKHAGIALGALGFGLCKTAISVAYITAMGSVSSTVGFVSELDFMFAMNAISFATALAIIALVRAGRLRPGALSQVPAVIALLVGFFLSATGVMAGLPFAATAVFYGVLCGFALTVLNAAWLEAFVAEPDAAYGVYQIVGGLIVQCVLVSALPLSGIRPGYRFWGRLRQACSPLWRWSFRPACSCDSSACSRLPSRASFCRRTAAIASRCCRRSYACSCSWALWASCTPRYWARSPRAS